MQYFFVNILNLLLKIIQVCVQVADFILKWRKKNSRLPTKDRGYFKLFIEG